MTRLTEPQAVKEATLNRMAFPGQLFFGQVSAHKPSTKSILLSFTPACKISGSSDIIVEHDLGKCLKTSCSKVSAEYWRLNAVFDPTVYKGKSTIDGSLSISLADGKIASANIPIHIQVK